MKKQTCCFTGHRRLAERSISQIKMLLEDEIRELANQGVINFLSGGALGFDLLAAKAVLRLKAQFPNIRLVMVLPCENQDQYWNLFDQIRYRNLINQSDEVIYLSTSYYDGCMLDRNCYLVNHSNFCIAYLTKTYGGTYFTVNYAKRNGIFVSNLADIIY